MRFPHFIAPAAAVVALLLSSVGASAGTILSDSGQNSSGYLISSSQFLAAGWTQGSAFTNISVSADLFVFPTANNGTAYIATSLGAGATTVASQTFAFPVSPASPVQLFSGLSLGPGTYYLVIASGNANNASDSWQGTTGTTFASDFGGTSAGFFFTRSTSPLDPPSSNFSRDDTLGLKFAVTGDAASVPEPGTLLLLSLGAGALFTRRRCRF